MKTTLKTVGAGGGGGEGVVRGLIEERGKGKGKQIAHERNIIWEMMI